MKENCFETQFRRVYKESPAQKNVIDIECLHQAINISASKRPLSILKNWTRSSYLLQYTEILMFSFRNFHCCSLGPNSSALHLGKSRSLIRSFNSSCVIRWNSLDWRSTAKSASVDAEGCGVFSRFSVGSSSESKMYCCSGTGTGKSSVWGTPVYSFKSSVWGERKNKLVNTQNVSVIKIVDSPSI